MNIVFETGKKHIIIIQNVILPNIHIHITRIWYDYIYAAKMYMWNCMHGYYGWSPSLDHVACPTPNLCVIQCDYCMVILFTWKYLSSIHAWQIYLHIGSFPLYASFKLQWNGTTYLSISTTFHSVMWCSNMHLVIERNSIPCMPFG